MGDKKTLEKLGEDFCKAVKGKIGDKDTDMNKQLNQLLSSIKMNKDSKMVKDALESIEKKLTKRGIKDKKIIGSSKKLRDFLDVKDQLTKGTTGEGHDNPSKSELTTIAETPKGSGSVEQNKQEYQLESTEETRFFVECLNGLKIIFDNEARNTQENIIPVPKGKIKDKVESGHKCVIDLVKGISRLKTENQHLRETLDGLYQVIIDGNETALSKSRKPQDTKDYPVVKELLEKSKEIGDKYHETKKELDDAYNKISALFTRMDGREERQVILAPHVSNKLIAQGGIPRNNAEQETEKPQKSIQLNEYLQVVASELEGKKEKEREADYAALLFEELNKYVANEGKPDSTTSLPVLPKPKERAGSKEGKSGDKKQNNEKPRLKHDEQLEKNFKTAYSVLEKLREADYAALLFEELHKYSAYDGSQDTQTRLPEPPIQKKREANNQNDEYLTARHTEQLQNSFDRAFSVLEKMMIQNELDRKAKLAVETKFKLQKIQNENENIKKEAESLRTRLSEHVALAVTHENPAITDLSDPNRPTKLAEKYSELYDNQWTDAFENISKLYKGTSDTKIAEYLYEMLVDCYNFCKDVREKQKQTHEEIMLYPPDGTQSSQTTQKNEDFNKLVTKALTDAAKMSGNVTGANIAKIFLRSDELKEKDKDWTKVCETYIECCVQICWLMQVQTPPVCIDLKTTSGQLFDKNVYREYTKIGKKVAFVVWPALLLHEKGPTLFKGVAQGQ